MQPRAGAQLEPRKAGRVFGIDIAQIKAAHPLGPERKRRLLRLHLGADLDAGLATLDAAFDELFPGEAR